MRLGKILLGQGRYIGSNPIACTIFFKKVGVDMQSMLLICRAIVWATSVGFWIVSMKTKKRTMLDCVKWVSLGSLFYLLLDIFVWPIAFDLQYGREIFGYYVLSAISGILLVNAMTVCNKKQKTVQREEGEDIQRWPILYLLVAVCLFAVFGLEYEILQDAQVLFVNENNGWGASHYSVALTDCAAVRVELGDDFFKEGVPSTASQYIVRANKKAFVVEPQGNAPELSSEQSPYVLSAVQFDGYVRRTEAVSGNKECLVTTINNSDMFTVLYYLTDTPGEIQTVLGQCAFRKDQFICNIDQQIPNHTIYVYEGE